MSYQIKELGVTEILDQSISLIKNHFGVLFGIVAILLIPFFLLQNFLPIFMLEELPVDADFNQIQLHGLEQVQITGILNLIAIVTVLPLSNAAVIFAVAQFYMGKTVSIMESISFAFNKLLPLIGISILVGIIVFLGFLALIIPGIFLYFRYLLCQHVVVLEGISPTAALKRSQLLMKGNAGKAFVLNLLVSLIVFGGGMVAGLVPEIHTQNFLLSVLQAVSTLVASAAFVVFYFSARCQHENYDLQLLAASFGDNQYSESQQDDDLEEEL